VGELERNIAAADQQHTLREMLEVEELVAGHGVLAAGEGKPDRLRAGGDHDMARAQAVVANRDCGLVEEARGAFECGDAGLGETLLSAGRHRVGEAALEGH
jgi:hypothetical protein